MNISVDKRRNDKIISWGISIGIHILLILIFIWVKYTLPQVTNYQEDYLEIALGTDEDGFGDQVPQWVDAPAPITPTSGATAQFNEDHNIETSTNAPDQVKINRRTQENKTVNTQKNNNPQNTQNKNITNNNSNQVDNNTPSENTQRGRTYTGSNTGGNLAQNNVDGTGRGNNPNGRQSVGTPGGNPTGTDVVPRSYLEGRRIVQYPPPKAKYNQRGVVKLQIWVDKTGKVTKHTILSSPSAELSKIASEKVKQTKFNAVNVGQDVQTGTIEFNFNVK